MKVCTVCKEVKALTDFYRLKASQDGHGYRCKVCDDLARRKYTQRHYKSHRQRARNTQLKVKYGITTNDYERMLKEQEYCCAVCKDHISKNKHYTGKMIIHRLSVDHCHKTGKVRGLLCNSCNRGIGFLKESREVLENALEYLK